MERHSKLKIGMKEARDSVTPFRDGKVKGQSLQAD